MMYIYLFFAALNFAFASWGFSGSGWDAFCVLVAVLNFGIFVEECTARTK